MVVDVLLQYPPDPFVPSPAAFTVLLASVVDLSSKACLLVLKEWKRAV